MDLSLTRPELLQFTVDQLNHFFPDPRPALPDEMQKAFDQSLERLEHCFAHVRNPYFHKDGAPRFHHLNSDQYAMYLYTLSRVQHENGGDPSLCEKIFYLNKTLHGLDCFFSVQLPDVFLFMHPLGTVLGRAEYGNYFFVSQNCTVGDNFDGEYPRLGEGVALYAGASVIGACDIGDNCEIGADATLYKKKVESGSRVFGKHPHNATRPVSTDVKTKHFR
ncbi:serine acetyltransferase [Nitrospina sp. 32_T5]|uniref:serine acetyltransferase n=1 Tax=unclassified Nitrospina TaxID=2638683 RepID=UPI003F9A7602